MIHRKITIVIRGKSETDIEYSFSEAVEHINDGNTSGTDSNEDGGYYFRVTEEVPRKEQSR